MKSNSIKCVHLGTLLDADQLMLPVKPERARPLVEWPDRLGVRAIQHPPAVPAHMDETNISQHAQVLRHRGLLQVQGRHDLPHGSLLQRQIVQDVSPKWFGDGIEGIGNCGSSRHDCHNTFPYENMSSVFSFSIVRKSS